MKNIARIFSNIVWFFALYALSVFVIPPLTPALTTSQTAKLVDFSISIDQSPEDVYVVGMAILCGVITLVAFIVAKLLLNKVKI